MPDDRVHIDINIVCLCLAGVVFLLWRALIERISYEMIDWFVVCAISYLFSSLYLSPDLDLDGGRLSVSQKRWGLLRTYWFGYREFFAHRGVSHIPIIGTITRYVYLILGVLVVILPSLLITYNTINWDFVIVVAFWLFVGEALADISHITADTIDTFRRIYLVL